jgi:hypothetical protein
MEAPDLNKFINKDGVTINVKIEPAQLALLAAGGFIVLFSAFLLSSLIVNKFFK